MSTITSIVNGFGWGNVKSYDFNGSTGYINMTDVLDCDRLEALSLSFFIKIDSFPGSGQERPLHKRDGTDEGWWVGAHDSGSLRFAFENDSGDISQVQTGVLSTATWYHIMLVAQSSGKSVSDLAIYVNNSLDTSTVVDNISSGSTSTSQPLCLGATNVPDNYFDGHLAHVAGWQNHALSGAERTAVYNSGAAHNLMSLSNPPDHYWRAHGDTTGAGNVVDRAGTANGTITGGVTIESDAP